MLFKNFFKDLINVTSRLTSVIIIAIVAVMVYVGLNGISYNGNLILNNYFKAQNVADFWITGNSFDKTDFDKIKDIPEINSAESRLVFEATDANNALIKLPLYGISSESTINKPYIVDGRAALNKNDMMISSEFAKVQGLKIGDNYAVKVAGSPKELTFKITALIKNPERMYNVSQTIPSPDYSKYGFAYVNEDSLSNILGKDEFNQIVVTLNNNVDKSQVKNKIIEKLNDKIVNLIEIKDNTNANNLLDFINGIKPIIQGLPLIFFAIAALLMVSTMTRLVENSRASIGTLKALGYADFTILLYYFMYSVIVVFFGFVIGGVLSKYIITKPISDILFKLNDLPSYVIHYDFSSLGKAFILITVSCMGTSLIITSNSLREKPAQCMRPKPPKKESRLLIERINFIWTRLGFNKKYIIKNTFRNKWRVFTCVFGIGSCMALILTCLSLKDSINNFTYKISNNQHRYDVYATLNIKSKDYDLKKVTNISGVRVVQHVMNTNAIVKKNNNLDTVNISVYEDISNLKLVDTYDGRTTLSSDGIILEDGLAKKFNLHVSDYIYIKFIGKDNYVKAKIVEVNKDVKGIYMSQSYFEKLGEKFMSNAVYVKTSNIGEFEKAASTYNFISDYQLKSTITDAIINKISVLSLVVFVLIALGGVLAIVVLYNLGIMSFYEQIRSLATLMVLGFYNKEIKKLQLTENIIFTILGIIIGIPLGVELTNIITSALTLASLKPIITTSSLIISAVLTFVFANIVNIIISKMMEKIDMLGALKSIE